MNTKTVLRWALLLFVVACFGTIVAKGVRARNSSEISQPPAAPESGAPAPTDPASPSPGQSRAKLVVTYFHGQFRCPTCLAIEAQAKLVVENDLADLVSQGTVEWRVVDFDQPGNEHYLQDYQLATQSLILSLRKDGKEVRWKNLERVWELVNNLPQFADYVQKEARTFLEQE